MSKESDRKAIDLGPGSPTTETSVVRTYLAMANPSELVRPSRAPTRPVALRELRECTVAAWRRLYAEVGAHWHWHDRDEWSDERIAERLANPDVRVFDLVLDDERNHDVAMGFLELERHADGSVEIVYLGVHLRVMGMGIGAWLVAEAVDRGFGLGATRVWLHTCTLDAPAALPNYLARGFTRERTETYKTRLVV